MGSEARAILNRLIGLYPAEEHNMIAPSYNKYSVRLWRFVRPPRDSVKPELGSAFNYDKFGNWLGKRGLY